MKTTMTLQSKTLILDAIVIANDDDDRNTTQLEHGETIQLESGNESESEEEFWRDFYINRKLRHDMHGSDETW